MTWQILLVAGWMLGPNGGWILHQLTAEPARSALPVEPLAQLADELWIVWHRQDAGPRAHYVPPGESPLAPAGLLGPVDPRALLDVPRLFLDASLYQQADGALRPVTGFAVDIADAYFAALYMAYLDLRIRRGSVALRLMAGQRAAEWLSEAPPEGRFDAYLEAWADFGGHALAVAAQLLRSEQRRPGRLCALRGGEVGLFGLWRSIFADYPYRAFYRQPETGQWVRSRAMLEPRDKAVFSKVVWGGRWSGDPETDFPWLCAGADRASESVPRNLPPGR